MTNSVILYRIEARRLAAKYSWRLLTEAEWAEAAQGEDPTAADERSARLACLIVYARALHAACQDPAYQDQAYRELYDYLLPIAYSRDSDLAQDAAQEALYLVLRSFRDPDRAQCRDPGIFLIFAYNKLRDALKHLWRLYRETGDEVESRQGQIPGQGPSLEEVVIQREWMAYLYERLAQVVFDGLKQLWRGKRSPHGQLSAAIYTYLDEVDDPVIARQLRIKPESVAGARSRGLDKLGEYLRTRMALDQGGYA